MVLYTDGVVINNAVGPGLYCDNPVLERPIPLGKYSSIFLAEMSMELSFSYIEISISKEVLGKKWLKKTVS